MRSKLPASAWLLPALAMVCSMAGCGDGRPTRVPVSGQVLIDGAPLTHGYVRFTPAGDSRVHR